MFKHLASSAIMHRNAAVISVTCILLCLTFNYTFPLHRESSKRNLDSYSNLSRICDKSDHRDKNKQRSSKRASNFELALKKLKDSTQDLSKNIQARFNSVKNAISEDNLREFEQLVIMKKNPYLDLKEIEQKLSPNDKHARQSVNYDTGLLPQNFVGDPGIWEPVEDIMPNVEVINRGLTGFAIPAKIVNANSKQSKVKVSSVENSDRDVSTKQDVKLDQSSNVLGNIRDDMAYLI